MPYYLVYELIELDYVGYVLYKNLGANLIHSNSINLINLLN